MKNRALIRLLAAPLLATFAMAAHAQANTFDVAAGGGLADYFGGGTNNSADGLVEVSAVYNFAAHAGIGFEYTYSPISTSSQSLTGFASFTNSNSTHLDHYGAVARFPFAAKAGMEPYAAVHFGLMHEVVKYNGFGTNVGTEQTQTYNGGYGGAGAGVNFFLAHNFGVRPELRYEYLRDSGSHLNELEVTGSVFYRFGGNRK